MDGITFDRKIEIPYNIGQLEKWHNMTGNRKKTYLENYFPNLIKYLSERQIKTLCNQNNHFAEIWAMNYFIEKESCNAHYIESGFITKYNTQIREIIEKPFTPDQKQYLFGVKNGGMPDLLVGNDNDWWFVEVKLIKNREDKLTKKQKEIFPNIQKLGLKLHLAYVVPNK